MSCRPALHLSATSTVTDVENTARAMSQLKTDISELGESHIPSILAELASLQDTHVLSGNYQLKLARQRYFLDKQLQVSPVHACVRAFVCLCACVCGGGGGGGECYQKKPLRSAVW